MAQITLRQLRREDLATYKALRLAALRDHPEAFGSAYEDVQDQTDEVWLERLRGFVGDKDAIAYLALHDDVPAGILTVIRDAGSKVNHYAAIYGVYVRPESRGHGIGERMVHEALDWCRREGIRNARLTVTTTNAAAIRCYVRCGFAVCGVAPEVVRVGDVYHDELVLWRRV